MKRTPLALALLVTASSIALGQVPAGQFSIEKVSPEVIKTPEYNITTGPQKRSGPSKSWLEVEVKYETIPDVTPELTFKYYILMQGKLLTGEVSYVNISKGRDHYAVMYVPPNALEGILGGKPLTAAAIENVGVEMTKGGLVVSFKSFKPSPPGQWWQQITTKIAPTPGMLVNKNETPFAPLFWDRYESIKPTK